MIHKFAIFYHARLTGGNPSVSPYARTIMREQMDLLVTTGLYEAANHLVVGLNGATNEVSTPPGAEIILHGTSAESELPTLCYLQEWLPGHDDWYVLYFHAKGARHGPDPLNIEWRRCMERAVIHKWRRCVTDLDAGCEAVGAHWLTPEQYPGQVKSPFFGGNFWWARASFLLILPKLFREPKDYNDFYAAENWIGAGRRPQIRDLAPHWPNLKLCAQTL